MSSTKQTVFALDCSGSTGGVSDYWKHVNSILNENQDRITKYILWHSKPTIVSLSEIKKWIQSRKGCGGTLPQEIIPYLNDGDDLILITDGEIGKGDVDCVNRNMLSKTLNSCDAHIISRRPDVSVVCGFSRGVNSTIKTYGDRIETIATLTEEDFRIVDQLDNLTLEEFLSKYKTIHQVLLNKMIGLNNIDKKLHDTLVAMKAKLHKEFIRSISGSFDIDTPLTEGRYEDAKIVSKRMIDEYYGFSPVKEFSSKFDTLINIVSAKTDFSVNQYNAIKSNTFSTATTLGQEEPETLLSYDVKKMECPIMLEEDAPVIPILSGEPVLFGEDKKVIDQILKNPLSILGFSNIVDKIKARLSQSIGIFSYCQICKTTNIHPMTREEMSGCIPLGSNKEYVNEASNAIMHLFTGGKVLGNVDLYYAVIYFIVKGIKYFDGVIEHVTDQMKYRMDNHKTSASLSGITDYVGTRILFKEAVWFVLTSGSLYTDNSIIPLRQHAFVIHYLLALNDLNGYIISKEDLNYCYTTRKMLSFLQKCKKDSHFKDQIRAQYQQHLILNDTYVFLDSPIDMLDDDENVKKNYAISLVVNPSKSASDISISDIPTSVTLPIEDNTWGYGSNIRHYKCTISTKTCRPIYNVDRDRTWEDSYKEFYQNCKMLSLNKYFGDYVVEKGEYPIITNFILYVWKRETGKGETTLPTNIENCVNKTYDEYSEIMSTISPSDFVNRFTKSVSRIDRSEMEKE